MSFASSFKVSLLHGGKVHSNPLSTTHIQVRVSTPQIILPALERSGRKRVQKQSKREEKELKRDGEEETKKGVETKREGEMNKVKKKLAEKGGGGEE